MSALRSASAVISVFFLRGVIALASTMLRAARAQGRG